MDNLTGHKITRRLQNSSVGKLLEGVCFSDNTWKHTKITPTSLLRSTFEHKVVFQEALIQCVDHLSFPIYIGYKYMLSYPFLAKHIYKVYHVLIFLI